MIPLPHTAGCLACGRDNPHGLHLSLSVDPDSGRVETLYTPTDHHIGFAGIAHGGAIATVFDEAMVWAATWTGRRFCYCGEMTIRFRHPAAIGRPLSITAKIESARSRLITTFAIALDADGSVVAEASGKYVPMPPASNDAIINSLVPEADCERAISHLRKR